MLVTKDAEIPNHELVRLSPTPKTDHIEKNFDLILVYNHFARVLIHECFSLLEIWSREKVVKEACTHSALYFFFSFNETLNGLKRGVY
jgi:hypothetical protein